MKKQEKTYVYCLVDGDIVRKKFKDFYNDGENLCVLTNDYMSFVFNLDAFFTYKEAAQEIKTRLAMAV